MEEPRRLALATDDRYKNRNDNPNEPYSWENLVDSITVQKELSLLAWSREQEIVYHQAHKLELERKWATVYD
jgi:hypothetical protein